MLSFSRLTRRLRLPRQDLLPGILLMSVGMGLIFIPFTLTATHGVTRDEAGIASAVLNTSQQMGGAVGLAALSTVAYGVFRSRFEQLSVDRRARAPRASSVALTHGFTVAFVVAAVMIYAASAIALVGLSIRHEELATDEPIVVGAG